MNIVPTYDVSKPRSNVSTLGRRIHSEFCQRGQALVIALFDHSHYFPGFPCEFDIHHDAVIVGLVIEEPDLSFLFGEREYDLAQRPFGLNVADAVFTEALASLSVVPP